MREARTTPLPAAEETPAPAQPTSEAETVLTKLKEAGLPYIDSTDPVGTCVLGDGTRLTLRELDGLDETYAEGFLDQFGLKPDGAGQSASLRFMALMSVATINGAEQAPIRHRPQLERLLKYRRQDLARIVAAYIRFNLQADGSPFRTQG